LNELNEIKKNRLKKAEKLVDGLAQEDINGKREWFHGRPYELVEIAVSLHEQGHEWDYIQNLLERVSIAIRREYGE
jgi:hypothetical protein